MTEGYGPDPVLEITGSEIEKQLALLSEALKILTEIPVDPPDMDVVAWNGTPIGRACNRIQDVIEFLEEYNG
jgi:hypothetical protein